LTASAGVYYRSRYASAIGSPKEMRRLRTFGYADNRIRLSNLRERGFTIIKDLRGRGIL